jgi:hypothetical protein
MESVVTRADCKAMTHTEVLFHFVSLNSRIGFCAHLLPKAVFQRTSDQKLTESLSPNKKEVMKHAGGIE